MVSILQNAMSTSIFALAVLFCLHAVKAQLLEPQPNTWNSTFRLTPHQIDYAGLDNSSVDNIEVAIRFEQSNWAGSSAAQDLFYQPPNNSTHLPPGSLLKVDEYTNTSLYTLPPNVAISRFLFQSETYNGSAVPASAYVLWPWMPREDPECPGKYAVVVWGHGASGVNAECGPSHIRNLWYQYSAPYILALQGYVVVAPDYAGLGTGQRANGSKIKHTAFSNAQGNDLVFAVEAAQRAFPELSHRFVIMGHSQGGHAAWAAAERLAFSPVKGYLGTVSGSPATNDTALLANPAAKPLAAAFIAPSLDEIFPSFKRSRWLTNRGARIIELSEEIGACNSGSSQLLAIPGILKDDFTSTWEFQAFVNLMTHGKRPFAGPMLVLQGTNDSMVPEPSQTALINNTCNSAPQSDLEYLTFEGVDHVAVLYASQTIWLQWIADRFAGEKASPPCSMQKYHPARPVASYQRNLNFFLEYATSPYEVA
ncbi:hypothetical protein DOTSEDRAFT_74462 [Dothistroma septosporum NZE10]|uniref:AB hydrolase-1 domain-containing protein n=1 Tax=Dothistroma septosporum (strain NZE10 / CBS 128990) TaxID=675120 RepID=N1PE68_DOTSN|nr:hypothetical protein DOTSEDRAFT_74462 [Dothistroma septosporum NZE10]